MKTMRTKILGAALALLAVSASDARAGAWTRESGGYYGKLSLSRGTADRLFSAKGGHRLPVTERRDDSAAFYSEYGLDDRWTGIAAFEFKRAERDQNGPSVSNSGPADAWLIAKRALWTGPLVLSAQAGVKLPLGYSKRATVPLGDGQIDWEGRILAGRSLGRGYAGAEIGYRKRNGDFSDEIPFRLEGGVWLGKGALLKATYDGVQNRTNDAASTTPLDRRAANVYDKEYGDFSPALLLFFPDGFGFEVFYKETIAGANAAVNQTWGAAVSWQGRRTSTP